MAIGVRGRFEGIYPPRAGGPLGLGRRRFAVLNSFEKKESADNNQKQPEDLAHQRR
jgi:hypothetical protein